MFKDKTGIRKIIHHAVLVDEAEVSNEVYLKVILLHLISSLVSYKTKFQFGDKRKQRSEVFQIVYVGKTVPNDTMNIKKEIK